MALRIVDEAAFDGPSLWHDRPVVRVVVVGRVAGALDDSRLLAFREAIEALDRRLDRTQLDPRPLPPAPARLDAPWLLAWAAVGLQRLAGDDVGFFAARDLESAGTSEVVVECLHRQTGLQALHIALHSLNFAAVDCRERMAAELVQAFTNRFVPVSASRRPTAELGCILMAARARGIPITSVDPRGLVRELGHGVHRRRLRHTSTSNTSYIGTLIARDKQLSLHYLAECGLPVPETLVAQDADQAVSNARQIGFPVVIKPNDEGNSAGLHLDVRNEDEARAAFAEAARISRSGTVVVQRYLTERHYRVLVVGDRIVGIAERIAAHVVGDGEHSVHELVKAENQNPRRGTRKSDRLKRIVIDETTMRLLEKQGLTLEDVPPKGLLVGLQRIDDLETGGEAIMKTGPVHPDNEKIILSAVRAIELDIAGVDLVAADIGQSIWETSGGILEVNCDTGFALIQFPTSEGAIDPGPAVIESLFPLGAPVRVPLVAVTGDDDRSEVAGLIGRLLTDMGHATGIALQNGLYLGTTRLSGFEGEGVAAKRRMLLNPSVETAVLEIPSDEMVAEGLAFEACDVAVVTGLSGASPEGLPEAESVVCRLVTPEGSIVVTADDPEAVELARSYGRAVVSYGVEANMERRRSGDRAVWWRETDDGGVLTIEWEGDDPGMVTVASKLGVSGRALAAAVGAVLALGIPRETIWQGMGDAGIAAVVG